uniref:protein ECERIFERUM 26-like n=1 Tax=Erigeron canadensis TaxID=72917 RepID=UPI001CB9ADE2|nr:protein ECERIFERUM 26-like [Erigeron canadensis]
MHNEQNSIYDVKISTVSAGFISGNDVAQELTEMDLAMKLHYLRFVYYFKKPAFDGFTIFTIKETMFNWLNHAYIPCGRIRKADSGRPFIKCNDSGVRIIEAKCHLSLDEWLQSRDDSRHKFLVSNQVLGPDLAFSPLVLIQLTEFKCGGTSVGLSWSHLLGDTISAVSFIKLWAQVIAGHQPAQILIMAPKQSKDHDFQNTNLNPDTDPLSVKRVGPVGDLWSNPNNSKMETFSFYISKPELTRLQEKMYEEKVDQELPVFEGICAVIWKSLAKVRDESGLKVVTVCKSDVTNRSKGIITNKSQTIGVVKTDMSVEKCSPLKLGLLIKDQADDEREKIEETMRNLDDFLIYGANLTFVDMSDATFYEMEVRGQTPVYVNCFIDSIGDQGVVLVLPTPKGDSDERTVSITVPENEMAKLKTVLKEDWCIE